MSFGVWMKSFRDPGSFVSVIFEPLLQGLGCEHI